jgi:hypothetical protein
MKTNAARLLDTLRIAYELRDYDPGRQPANLATTSRASVRSAAHDPCAPRDALLAGQGRLIR